MLTASIGTPSARAVAARISAMCGASFGCSAMIVTSTCPTASRWAASAATAPRTKRVESALWYCGSSSGNNEPMSPRAAAPSSASVIAWSTTSPSE
ncbi:MAG: hypothetical protein A2083_04330 [Gemmatimonadetes bacterium GWC2_71_9]|nr:MAG: hypothetical protein A2083_04330 [Gemmatimonadetes bacterium GWC2_71_9]